MKTPQERTQQAVEMVKKRGRKKLPPEVLAEHLRERERRKRREKNYITIYFDKVPENNKKYKKYISLELRTYLKELRNRFIKEI